MGSEEVAVDIAIIVDYGTPVPEIAQNIQMAVMKAVETMTGLKVVEVNISIQGIKFKETSSKEQKEEKPEKETSRVNGIRIK